MDSYTSEGAGALKTKYVNGVLNFYRTDGEVIQTINPTTGEISFGTQVLNVVRNHRQRVTLAQWNAGATLLAAPGLGRAYRLVSGAAIAYGGAAGALTTADIEATQSAGAVKLVAFAQASLTQSTLLRDVAILADGASFVVNDVNTAITAGVTGADLTVATGIDVFLTYVIETA